jgi:hypothetical protein
VKPRISMLITATMFFAALTSPGWLNAKTSGSELLFGVAAQGPERPIVGISSKRVQASARAAIGSPCGTAVKQEARDLRQIFNHM